MTREEQFCLAILAGLSVLMPLAGGFEPFFCWTAAGTALLGIAAVFNLEARRDLLLLGFLLPTALIAIVPANRIVTSLTPQTIDAQMFRIGHGFSTVVYHWTLHHSTWWMTLNAIYYALPFFGAMVLCVSPRRRNCVAGWILAAMIAPFFYVAFPATGPAHVGEPHAARNCIPSLHMTWALLCAIYVAPRWRRVAIGFAVLTAVSTLATGEHYLLDLVLAVPYTWMIWYLERAVGHRLPGALGEGARIEAARRRLPQTAETIAAEASSR